MRTLLLLLAAAAGAAAQDDPAARAKRAVVGVQARRTLNMNFGGRSVNRQVNVRQAGVVIGKDGLVLTSTLGEDARNVRVYVAGTGDPLEAEVLDSDDSFSVLKVTDLKAEPLTFKQDWKPAVGARLVWIGVLAGAQGKWTPVSKAATVDAVIADDSGATPLVYSDPPFTGPVSAVCALVLDGDGNAVGLMVPRQRQITGGGGRGRRGGFRGAQSVMPLVRPAAAFLHYLSGDIGPRGVLGVMAEALGEKVAEAMGLKETKGVLVTQVTPGSGAEDAGVEPQDVITMVAEQPTPSLAALQKALRGKRAGDKVSVVLHRLSEEGPIRHEYEVTLGKREESDKESRIRAPRFGIVAEPLTAAMRASQGLGDDVKGVSVRRVTPGGPAALGRPAPLRRGDILLRVGDTPVPDGAALKAALAAVPNGQTVTLFVRRGADTRFVDIRPEAPADDGG